MLPAKNITPNKSDEQSAWELKIPRNMDSARLHQLYAGKYMPILSRSTGRYAPGIIRPPAKSITDESKKISRLLTNPLSARQHKNMINDITEHVKTRNDNMPAKFILINPERGVKVQIPIIIPKSMKNIRVIPTYSLRRMYPLEIPLILRESATAAGLLEKYPVAAIPHRSIINTIPDAR